MHNVRTQRQSIHIRTRTRGRLLISRRLFEHDDDKSSLRCSGLEWEAGLPYVVAVRRQERQCVVGVVSYGKRNLLLSVFLVQFEDGLAYSVGKQN